jgi:hypothetical protein
VVVYGLSAFSLAAQTYSRWLTSKPVSFPFVYCVTLALVIGWGLIVVGADGIGSAPSEAWILALCSGVAGGVVAKRLDGAILRSLDRYPRWRIRPPRDRAGAGGTDQPARVAVVASAQGRSARRRRSGMRRIQENRRSVLQGWQWGIASSCVVAALEETLHRGVLLETARMLPGQALFAMGCVALMLIFALSHIWFGPSQVAAKLPLGLLTLGLVLIYGTLAPAIVAHVVFNLLAVADGRSEDPVRLLAWGLAIVSPKRR